MAKLPKVKDQRLLLGLEHNEDAAVLHFPSGKALVNSLDFFTPIVNDPYKFGQIAAANSLSDLYAMGATPWSAMNIVCFPSKTMSSDILSQILQGGLDKILEAKAVPAGGHSVEDPEIKYGLSVCGYVDPDCIASNQGLRPGDQLILTKPLGTGILAGAIKAKLENFEKIEEELYFWTSRLNKVGGEAISKLKLKAATDITGFGLGGHLLEMATGSNLSITLFATKIPILNFALDLANLGFIPCGSFSNKKFYAPHCLIADNVNPLYVDLIFDAQTSGGLVLAVSENKLNDLVNMLKDNGEEAYHIGEVINLKPDNDGLSYSNNYSKIYIKN